MMKYKPYAIAGIAFVVSFILIVILFQCGGVWDPPGSRGGTGHEDHDDHGDEQTIEIEHNEDKSTETDNHEVVLDTVYISDSLLGSKNLLNFLKDNDIPVDCVAKGLGISESEMNETAGTIKVKLDMHMSDVRAVIDICLGLEPREDIHEDENVEGSEVGKTEKEEVASTESIEVVILDEIPTEEDHEPRQNSEDDGIGRGQGRESGDGSYENTDSGLPQLMGSDNISTYCETNGISKSCVAQKLGITEDGLDIGGGELSTKLNMKMFELRDVVLSCS
ncbi:MAG: hypothetical protein KAH30_01245 [Caldisericia bacterium]|nr:hypothetical protein [Caldisericia bacterium]